MRLASCIVMENKIKFVDLQLSEDIQNAIAEMGFVEASPIQSQSIPLLLAGRDVLGQAQTGTGKTAAFGIPAIENIDIEDRDTQCLVLCPTRELALQVSNEFAKLAKFKKGLRTLAVYGGESIDRQIKALKGGIHVVIGTPGRVIDHIDRGTLKLDRIKMIVLDEADEMLNMGFIDDIKSILSEMPEERQTVFFSATMPREIMELTKKFQKDPEVVKITRSEITVSNIEQSYYEVRNDIKSELLTRLIDFHNLKLMLVFCNTKRKVDELVEDLQSKGYGAEGLHGDMRQQQRNNVMAKFRSGVINALVATDVAARGIDVDSVEAVFNYDVPLDAENYVHRIGRTGRAGKSGMSFTFVTRSDQRLLREIMQYTKANINKSVAPSAKDVIEQRKTRYMEQIKELINQGGLSKYTEIIENFESQGVEPSLIAAALLKMNFSLEVKEINVEERERVRSSDDRGNRRERDRSVRSERGDRDRGDRDREPRTRSRSNDRGDRDDSKMVRLFLNAGRADRVSPGDIVGAIAGETGLKGSMIGAIDIFDKYSFVDLPKEHVEDVIEKMSRRKIKGVKVNMEVAN